MWRRREKSTYRQRWDHRLGAFVGGPWVCFVCLGGVSRHTHLLGLARHWLVRMRMLVAHWPCDGVRLPCLVMEMCWLLYWLWMLNWYGYLHLRRYSRNDGNQWLACRHESANGWYERNHWNGNDSSGGPLPTWVDDMSTRTWSSEVKDMHGTVVGAVTNEMLLWQSLLTRRDGVPWSSVCVYWCRRQRWEEVGNESLVQCGC